MVQPNQSPEWTKAENEALWAVREAEAQRIEAIHQNDTEAMSQIIDDKFLYINSDGATFNKEQYLLSVASRQLTYATDVKLTETEYRIDDDLVIVAGEMLGHARLDGEAQVFRLRSMRVWRCRADVWKLLAWQSSSLLRPGAWP